MDPQYAVAKQVDILIVLGEQGIQAVGDSLQAEMDLQAGTDRLDLFRVS
jgi:hypothetical protein